MVSTVAPSKSQSVGDTQPLTTASTVLQVLNTQQAAHQNTVRKHHWSTRALRTRKRRRFTRGKQTKHVPNCLPADTGGIHFRRKLSRHGEILNKPRTPPPDHIQRAGETTTSLASRRTAWLLAAGTTPNWALCLGRYAERAANMKQGPRNHEVGESPFRTKSTSKREKQNLLLATHAFPSFLLATCTILQSREKYIYISRKQSEKHDHADPCLRRRGPRRQP